MSGIITVKKSFVTGNGTLFSTELKINNFIIIEGDFYQIKSIENDVSMELVTVIKNDVTDVSYYIESAISRILDNVPDTGAIQLNLRIKTLGDTISMLDETVIDLYSIIDEQSNDILILDNQLDIILSKIGRLESIAGKFILNNRS